MRFADQLKLTAFGCLALKAKVCSSGSGDLHMRADEIHNRLCGSPGLEDFRDPNLFERGNILIRDNASHDYQNIIQALRTEQLAYPRNDRVVCPGKNGNSDDAYILLQGGTNNLLRRLPQAAVDDFHAGVTQGAGNNLGPAVVSIQAGFGD
jgi:hypothetical protein